MLLYDKLVTARHALSERQSQLRRLFAGNAGVFEMSNVARWVDDSLIESAPRSEDGSYSVQPQIVRATPQFDVSWFEWASYRPSSIAKAGLFLTRETRPAGGWVVRTSTMCYERDSGELGASRPGGFEVELDVSGTIVGSPKQFGFDATGHQGDCAERQRVAGTVLCGLIYACYAIRLSHAKGVKLTERQAPRHERRAAMKVGRTPLVRYYVLEISPTTAREQKQVMREESRQNRAWHICRGHFADYTQGAGLFGKHKVEVFVSEHARGRPDRGMVFKDYRISP